MDITTLTIDDVLDWLDHELANSEDDSYIERLDNCIRILLQVGGDD